MSALWWLHAAPFQGPSGRERSSDSDFIFFKTKTFQVSKAINCAGYMLMSFTES